MSIRFNLFYYFLFFSFQFKVIGGQRDLSEALNFVHDDVFTAKSGSRASAEKLLLVFIANDRLIHKDKGFIETINKLKAKNVKIGVIAINTDIEIAKKIATSEDLIVVVTIVKKIPETIGELENKIRGVGRFLNVADSMSVFMDNCCPTSRKSASVEFVKNLAFT